MKNTIADDLLLKVSNSFREIDNDLGSEIIKNDLNFSNVMLQKYYDNAKKKDSTSIQIPRCNYYIITLRGAIF